MYHPSGRALYTTSVAPPYYPNCTDVETWDIDPNSGSLTFVGTYSYYLECWVSLQAFNLAGKFAYSYHHGLYYHDVPGWDLVRVDPNTGGLTSGGYPGYDLPSLAQVEPTQGKYFVGFQSGTINSIPIDPATGLLSSPVANVPPSDPSVSDLVLVAPDNEAPEGRPSLRTLIEICEWAPRRHYGTVGP